MKIKFNRFAFTPHICHSCKQYILFEPYRRSDVYHIIGGFYKETICKDCIKKYDVKESEEE